MLYVKAAVELLSRIQNVVRNPAIVPAVEDHAEAATMVRKFLIRSMCFR